MLQKNLKIFKFFLKFKKTIERFHMTSRRPYWCSKTIKRRPCWCTKQILWELNSFLMKTLPFVLINLHRCWSREWKRSIIIIIIRSKFFFLFIGREPTKWPANNCVQIMVCSWAMLSNSVWLQIIFCSYMKETVLFSFLWSLLCENGRSLRFAFQG